MLFVYVCRLSMVIDIICIMNVGQRVGSGKKR